jgi:hypothetical protein
MQQCRWATVVLTSSYSVVVTWSWFAEWISYFTRRAALQARVDRVLHVLGRGLRVHQRWSSCSRGRRFWYSGINAKRACQADASNRTGIPHGNLTRAGRFLVETHRRDRWRATRRPSYNWATDVIYVSQDSHAAELTQRKPRQRPRAEGGRPRRSELRHNSPGPIQLPPRSLRTRVGVRFTGFATCTSGR